MTNDFNTRLNELLQQLGHLKNTHKINMLSEICSVSRPTAQRWLTCDTPKANDLLLIARKFNVSIDWLLGHDKIINTAEGDQLIHINGISVSASGLLPPARGNVKIDTKTIVNLLGCQPKSGSISLVFDNYNSQQHYQLAYVIDTQPDKSQINEGDYFLFMIHFKPLRRRMYFLDQEMVVLCTTDTDTRVGEYSLDRILAQADLGNGLRMIGKVLLIIRSP